VPPRGHGLGPRDQFGVDARVRLWVAHQDRNVAPHHFAFGQRAIQSPWIVHSDPDHGLRELLVLAGGCRAREPGAIADPGKQVPTESDPRRRNGCTLGEGGDRRDAAQPGESFLCAEHHLAMPGRMASFSDSCVGSDRSSKRGDPTVASLAWRKQRALEVRDEGAAGHGQRLISGFEVVVAKAGRVSRPSRTCRVRSTSSRARSITSAAV